MPLYQNDAIFAYQTILSRFKIDLINMDISNTSSFIENLENIVGKRNVVTNPNRLSYYQTGFRMGKGDAIAAVLPGSLLELWSVLKACVECDYIIIMQAANTGLNGGSTPDGNDYDRDIVIINTLKIDQVYLLNDGAQIVGLAGSTLYKLEDILEGEGRTPHSIIGSSCIGASIVGGVCNNSGGSLVNRGPAYTELSLYAQVNDAGELELINHLELSLGDQPEEILENLQSGNFSKSVASSNKLASDTEYEDRVRDVNALSPARFNADKRRLFEASGCAGKLAVFAVRLDTFEAPKEEQVFYIGSNDPVIFSEIRERILSEFQTLPELGEYMHRSYFEAAEKYCKDTYLFIKLFGTSFLPKLFSFKSKIDGYLRHIPFLPDKFLDHFLQFASRLLPNHLPHRIRRFRTLYDHQLMIKANDDAIEPMKNLLSDIFSDEGTGEFFLCTKKEGDSALLHRFVAGGASVRYAIIHNREVEGLMPFDIALRRNDTKWHEPLPNDIYEKLAGPFVLSHFFCHVFHYDFVVKKGVDIPGLKSEIATWLDERGAKYPAEHNVGHLYTAEPDLRNFYQSLDPLNMFNSGVGKTSKLKNYQ